MAVQLRPEPATQAAPRQAPDADTRTTWEIAALVFGPVESRTFAIRLWNGLVEAPAGGEPAFTLVLRHPGALRRMFLPATELNLAESYLRDDFDVEGDIERATLLGDEIAERLRAKSTVVRLLLRLLRLPRGGGRPLVADGRARAYGDGKPLPAFLRLPHYIWRHSRRRDAESVSFTYNTSNAFYALWLDDHMQYTCAYFRTGKESLAEAQQAKLELICRKLRLAPGQRLLDLGCGWGGLLRYAADRYGISGLGVTLSAEQAEWANASFARAGLADRVRAEVRDYRDLPVDASWDRVTVVGMMEHVGVANVDRFLARVHGLLNPGGLHLNQCIVCLYEPPARSGEAASGRVLRQHNPFIQKYLFPDAEMPTVAEVVTGAERAGFEVRDVESLREHYVTTFRHWLRRLEQRADDVRAIVGEEAYRAFRLYLAAFPPRFEGRWSGLTQVLMAKPTPGGRTAAPRSRDDVYADASLVGGT
jgi:cyclopropane-fatty-acyl-phospholipid synthase